MKIKSLSKEEIESMQYDDLAYLILREKGKKMKTADIFKMICDLVGLSENDYQSQIADFFTLLATEKRFLQLPKGYWDLKENHTRDAKMEDNSIENEDEEEIDIEIEERTEEKELNTDEEFFDSDNDDDLDDGLKDLVVIDDMEEGE